MIGFRGSWDDDDADEPLCGVPGHATPADGQVGNTEMADYLISVWEAAALVEERFRRFGEFEIPTGLQGPISLLMTEVLRAKEWGMVQELEGLSG